MTTSSDILSKNLVKDGSIIELHKYTARPGALEDFAEEWKTAFKAKDVPGLSVEFCLVDSTYNRLLYAIRYEDDFDMRNKYYLGHDPVLAQCVLSGSRAFISPVYLPHITDLPESGEIELKIYNVKPSMWGEFFPIWRRIVELREQAGFKVPLAYVDEATNGFIWTVAHGGEWKNNNVNYLSGDERHRLNTLSDSIASFEMPHVQSIWGGARQRSGR